MPKRPAARSFNMLHSATRATALQRAARFSPTARRSSSPDSSGESGRQSRSCSFEGGENPASSCGNGGHRRSGCRVSEGGVREGRKGLPETPPRCRGRRVPEIHRQVREANFRVGLRARVRAAILVQALSVQTVHCIRVSRVLMSAFVYFLTASSQPFPGHL